MRDVPVKVVHTPREVRERLALLPAPERNPPPHRSPPELVPDLVDGQLCLGACGGICVKRFGFVLRSGGCQARDADADQAEGGAGGFALQEGEGRVTVTHCHRNPENHTKCIVSSVTRYRRNTASMIPRVPY